MGFGAILASPMVFNFDVRVIWHQIAQTSKLKTMHEASMAPNPIILRYHFGNFVH